MAFAFILISVVLAYACWHMSDIEFCCSLNFYSLVNDLVTVPMPYDDGAGNIETYGLVRCAIYYCTLNEHTMMEFVRCVTLLLNNEAAYVLYNLFIRCRTPLTCDDYGWKHNGIAVTFLYMTAVLLVLLPAWQPHLLRYTFVTTRVTEEDALTAMMRFERGWKPLLLLGRQLRVARKNTGWRPVTAVTCC